MNYFVTGTDTDVGKTLISCALLQAFAGQGLRVTGMKPVACNEGAVSEDVRQLAASSNVQGMPGQVNPYFFERAVAPHLAAELSGVRINLERIVQSYCELATQADVVIVEGTGGYLLPLNDQEDGADLARQLKLPVIMVVGMRLGCINHALLTSMAIAASGLKLAGWVANCVDKDMKMREENIAALQQRIAGPLLGVVPNFKTLPDIKEVAKFLELSLLHA